MAFREARLAAGMTVEAVTKALKVSDAAVYLWETGQTFPKSSRLPEVAKLYNVTIEDLLAPAAEESARKEDSA